MDARHFKTLSELKTYLRSETGFDIRGETLEDIKACVKAFAYLCRETPEELDTKTGRARPHSVIQLEGLAGELDGVEFEQIEETTPCPICGRGRPVELSRRYCDSFCARVGWHIRHILERNEKGLKERAEISRRYRERKEKRRKTK